MAGKNMHKKTYLNIRLDVWVSVFLIIATFAVYWQVKNHEFINFDDDLYVTKNHYVKTGLTLKNIAWSFTATHAKNWHPLTWLSHMLDCQISGMNPGRHHMTNVFFHIVNTLLLFVVLRRMSGNLWRSGFVAALFALHPLHVESVAWVAERKDVLSTFFWMLTMYSYVRYVERPRVNRYLLVLLLFILGLMAKPMLVTLPFVLILLDYWPLCRFRFGQSDRGNNNSQLKLLALRLLWEKTPLFIFAAASSVATFLVQKSGGAVGSLDEYPLNVRIANAIVSYVSYIGKTIWPNKLAVFYPHYRMLPWWQVATACLLLVTISFLVIRTVMRRPYFAVGWLWYIGTLIPIIGLVQVGSQAMADRYTYVPLIGLFIIIAWGVPELLTRWRYSKRVFVPVSVALLSILMVTTWIQVRYWTNSITLFEHVLDVTTNNSVAHNNLGNALAKEGRAVEAISHYFAALRIDPDYALAINNLGLVFAEEGRTDEAIRYYSKALQINPDFKEAHNNLGLVMAKHGRTVEAIDHYSKALQIDPYYQEAQINMGVALASQGNFDKATALYYQVLRLNSGYDDIAHYHIGNVLAAQSKFDKAIGHYSEALRINPDFKESHNNLGVALIRKGKTEEAIFHFREALRIKPDDNGAHNNLKKALSIQERSQ